MATPRHTPSRLVWLALPAEHSPLDRMLAGLNAWRRGCGPECFRVRVDEQRGRCVVTRRAFASGDFVMEYEGELVKVVEAHRREMVYKEERLGCFLVDIRWKGKPMVIDASLHFGTLGRLVNHARNGNLRVFRLLETEPGGGPRMALFAKRAIAMGEELFWDYGMKRGETDWASFKCPKLQEQGACEIVRVSRGIQTLCLDPAREPQESINAANEEATTRNPVQGLVSNTTPKLPRSKRLSLTYRRQILAEQLQHETPAHPANQPCRQDSMNSHFSKSPRRVDQPTALFSVKPPPSTIPSMTPSSSPCLSTRSSPSRTLSPARIPPSLPGRVTSNTNASVPSRSTSSRSLRSTSITSPRSTGRSSPKSLPEKEVLAVSCAQTGISGWEPAFTCDPDFCPVCGAILPLPADERWVQCPDCAYKVDTEKWDCRFVTTKIVFNRRIKKSAQ